MTNLQQDGENHQSGYQTCHLRQMKTQQEDDKARTTDNNDYNKKKTKELYNWVRKKITHSMMLLHYTGVNTVAKLGLGGTVPVIWHQYYPGPYCERRSSWQRNTGRFLLWCYTNPERAAPEADRQQHLEKISGILLVSVLRATGLLVIVISWGIHTCIHYSRVKS